MKKEHIMRCVIKRDDGYLKIYEIYRHSMLIGSYMDIGNSAKDSYPNLSKCTDVHFTIDPNRVQENAHYTYAGWDNQGNKLKINDFKNRYKIAYYDKNNKFIKAENYIRDNNEDLPFIGFSDFKVIPGHIYLSLPTIGFNLINTVLDRSIFKTPYKEKENDVVIDLQDSYDKGLSVSLSIYNQPVKDSFANKKQ